MTEEQWLAATEPQAMLEWLSETGRADDRGLRLFSCACCRRIWSALLHEPSRTAVVVAERFADGLATEEELRQAERGAYSARADQGVHFDATDAAWDASRLPVDAVDAAWAAAAEFASAVAGYQTLTGAAADAAYYPAENAERVVQCQLLRCIFGNPFQSSPRISESVLSWNDRTVVRIAETLYREQRWDEVAILADALEEAGCEDAGLIEHLRGPGPHCRGCHGIDAILGKA